MANKRSNKKTDHITPEIESIFSTFNPKYTFDNFVVGDRNRFAYEAARAVADNPINAYNPLYIYGHVGNGTSHLLNAVGNALLETLPSMNVCFYSAEKFMREMLNHLRASNMDTFRKRFLSVDVLMIDGIQFLSGKIGTQEELLHTIEALYEAKKQIVVGSGLHPKQIPNLDERLQSYFECGLIVEIEPPDTETKIAILKLKSEQLKIAIPKDVINYLATSKARTIRELGGMLIRLGAFSNLQNMPITLEMAEESLRDIIGYAGAKIKLAFDIGGVLGKYPTVFLPMISSLQNGGTEVFVLTDIPDMKVTQEQLNRYGYSFPPEMILCADFERHGERCKSVLIKEYGNDLLVDDHPGYCADSGCVSLFVWPDPHKPYESQ